MQDTNFIQPLAEALGRWHEFYMLLGTASATLVGLLFVAATVGSGVFTSGRRAALRVFLSTSVTHFDTILVSCLIVLVPVQSWISLGAMIASCGSFGLGYHGLFLSAHAFIYGHFPPRRHRMTATNYRASRATAFKVWRGETSAQMAS
jgi:hypothetical protein